MNSVINNECSYIIQGEIDINSSAAVLATRGSQLTTTKTGTGTYQVVLKDTSVLQLVEVLHREANYSVTVPATALGVGVTTVTQSASTGDITITIVTTAAATSGAATDGTAATTIDFEVVIRTCRLVSPI
jgi:hypothetical protein